MYNNYPLISVIIINYNNERFIEKALLSVINQTYKNLEIIIVDDHSNNSKVYAIYNKYINIDKRIKLHINKDNLQLFDSRLKGIELANGQYTCWLDGDDYLDLDFIRHMYLFLLKNNADVVCSNFCYVIENTCIIDHKQKFKKAAYFKQQENVLNFLFDSNAASYAANLIWNKLYKTSLLKKVLQEIKETDLINRKLHTSEDFLINAFVYKETNNLYIDEVYIGNYYRRSKPVECIDKTKKIKWIQELNFAFSSIYKYFIKNQLIINDTKQYFYNYVINTFSQHLTLLSLDVNDLPLLEIASYLEINPKDIDLLKNQIKKQNNEWLFPKVFKFKNEIAKYKAILLKNNEIEFNLENGIYFVCNLKNKTKYFLNENIFDLLCLALWTNKKIIVHYQSKTLLQELKQLIEQYQLNPDCILFVKVTNNNGNQTFNFVINKKYVCNKFTKYYFLNKQVKNYLTLLNKKTGISFNDLSDFYNLCCIITNDVYLFTNRSIFNYSYSLFYCFNFMFLARNTSLQSIEHSLITQFINVINNVQNIDNDAFYVFEQEKAFFYLNKLKELVSDFPFLTSDKLLNFYFVNLKMNYEANNLIPSLIQYKTTNEFNIDLKQVWVKDYKYFNKHFKNLPKTNKTFWKLVYFLFNNQDIFNNESYMALRKHPRFLKFTFTLIKRKIK